MKARTLVPALALAAALLAPPLADARDRHGPRGRRPPAHGYYGHRPGHGSYGYRPVRPRPFHRGYRRYRPAPYYGYYPPAYYGYGFGHYPPPPPPRYCPPRPRVGVWFGF
jgi:hypothetical protein